MPLQAPLQPEELLLLLPLARYARRWRFIARRCGSPRPNITLQHDAAKSAIVKLFTCYQLTALK